MKSKLVSLCVIIKNSEDVLDIFFKWALDNFEEICVVVDTENYDNTLEKCKWYNFHYHEIILLEHSFDNFSNQWKRSFELATNDWIFYIGADEILSPVDLDNEIKALQRLKKKVGVFPRYNIQKSRHRALELGYPDYQFRLFNKTDGTTMDGNSVDESLNCKDSFILFPQHIIHLGHVRPVNALVQKGKDRYRFKDEDKCDGPGLNEHKENWFIERNKKFEEFIFTIPDKETIEQIEKYIPMEFI